MAYEKYFFDRSSILANANDVARWLTENASEYFDSFEVDTTTNAAVSSSHPLVVCKLGDTARLEFCASNPAASTSGNASKLRTLHITAAGSASTTLTGHYDSGHAVSYMRYAIKTAGGIMLYLSQYYVVYITKTNEDTTAVYTNWYYQSGSSVQTFSLVDLVKSRVIDNTSMTNKVTASDMTSLGPVCFSGGTYAPDLFVSPYTQYKGQVGMIYVDGTVYAYDGYVGLKC